MKKSIVLMVAIVACGMQNSINAGSSWTNTSMYLKNIAKSYSISVHTTRNGLNKTQVVAPLGVYQLPLAPGEKATIKAIDPKTNATITSMKPLIITRSANMVAVDVQVNQYLPPQGISAKQLDAQQAQGKYPEIRNLNWK